MRYLRSEDDLSPNMIRILTFLCYGIWVVFIFACTDRAPKNRRYEDAKVLRRTVRERPITRDELKECYKLLEVGNTPARLLVLATIEEAIRKTPADRDHARWTLYLLLREPEEPIVISTRRIIDKYQLVRPDWLVDK